MCKYIGRKCFELLALRLVQQAKKDMERNQLQKQEQDEFSKNIITKKEIAIKFGVCFDKVYKWIKNGTLPKPDYKFNWYKKTIISFLGLKNYSEIPYFLNRKQIAKKYNVRPDYVSLVFHRGYRQGKECFPYPDVKLKRYYWIDDSKTN